MSCTDGLPNSSLPLSELITPEDQLIDERIVCRAGVQIVGGGPP